MSPLPLSTWHLQPFRTLHTEKGGTELKEDREKAKFKQRPQTRELTAFVSLSVCVCSCVLWWCAHTHISITASRKCCLIEGSWAVMRASSTRTHMHTQRFCKLKNKRRKTHYKSSPFHSLSLLHPLCVFGSFFFSSSFFFQHCFWQWQKTDFCCWDKSLLLRQKPRLRTKRNITTYFYPGWLEICQRHCEAPLGVTTMTSLEAGVERGAEVTKRWRDRVRPRELGEGNWRGQRKRPGSWEEGGDILVYS